MFTQSQQPPRTKDYDQFLLIKGNRPIDQNAVQELVKAIAAKDLLSVNPIIINEKKEIIDGQHRREAARILDRYIYYVAQPGLTIADVRNINAKRRNWQMENFAESNSQLGNPHYQALEKFRKQYGLSFSLSITLLTGSTKNKNDAFKDGSFQIINEEAAHIRAQELNEFKIHVQRDVWRTKPFADAIKQIYDRKIVTHKELLNTIRNYCVNDDKKIPNLGNARAYRYKLQEIYNYRKSSGKKDFTTW